MNNESSPEALSSPHPRGDGSYTKANNSPQQQFSPPAWGWFVGPFKGVQEVIVLPTRVGMVRIYSLKIRLTAHLKAPPFAGTVKNFDDGEQSPGILGAKVPLAAFGILMDDRNA